MNPHNRLKDPLYAQLAFHIESEICQADEAAKSAQILLSDSQVRSALLRTVKVLKGQSPDIPKGNDRERVLAELGERLLETRKEVIFEEVDNEENQESATVPIWCNACETVAASIKARKSDTPGSRLYLDFIHGFIEHGKQF